ncbi:methyl-accepting chemotaxis protein [Pseudoneobacillus sp. C159]
MKLPFNTKIPFKTKIPFNNKLNLNTKINRKSVKTKLIASMTAIALIPTISIAIISNSITHNVMEKELASSTFEVTKQVSQSLDYRLDGVANQINMLAQNVYFKNFNSMQYAAENGYYLLSGTQITSSDYSSVYFGTPKRELIISPKQKLPEDYDPTHQPWYIGAVQRKGEIFYSDPYKDTSTGEMVISLARAISDSKGSLVGVVGVNLNLVNFSHSLSEINIGKDGYMTVVGRNDKYITHPVDEQIGTTNVTKISLWNDIKKDKEGYGYFTLKGHEKLATYVTNERTGWKFIAELDRHEITSSADSIRTIGWLLTLVFGVFSAVFAYIIGRRISNNVLAVKSALDTTAKGDFTARVFVKTNDEFNALAQSFNQTMEQLSSSLQKVEETSKTVMETSAHLSIMTEETNASVSEVASAIEQISQGATLQSRNIHVSFDSMRDLSQKLDVISQATEDINDVSQRSMGLSNKGLEKVLLLADKANVTKTSTDEVATIVKEVEVKMGEINSIISAITKITDQTNLLSLNASIESARAGEHGRGFAVVANEVRKLSEQSRASAVEIKRIVDSIQEVVKEAVKAMERTNHAVAEQDVAVTETKAIFNDTLAIVHELAKKVEEVQGSVQESQTNKETVTLEMDSITAVSEETAAATEEVSATTEEISVTMSSFTQRAAGLKELSEQLDNEIKKFKLQ